MYLRHGAKCFLPCFKGISKLFQIFLKHHLLLECCLFGNCYWLNWFPLVQVMEPFTKVFVCILKKHQGIGYSYFKNKKVHTK